jgi:hypothetical protein
MRACAGTTWREGARAAARGREEGRARRRTIPSTITGCVDQDLLPPVVPHDERLAAALGQEATLERRELLRRETRDQLRDLVVDEELRAQAVPRAARDPLRRGATLSSRLPHRGFLLVLLLGLSTRARWGTGRAGEPHATSSSRSGSWKTCGETGRFVGCPSVSVPLGNRPRVRCRRRDEPGRAWPASCRGVRAHSLPKICQLSCPNLSPAVRSRPYTSD